MAEPCGERHGKTDAPCLLDKWHVGNHRSVTVVGPPPLAVIEWAPGLQIATGPPMTSEREG